MNGLWDLHSLQSLKWENSLEARLYWVILDRFFICKYWLLPLESVGDVITARVCSRSCWLGREGGCQVLLSCFFGSLRNRAWYFLADLGRLCIEDRHSPLLRSLPAAFPIQLQLTTKKQTLTPSILCIISACPDVKCFENCSYLSCPVLFIIQQTTSRNICAFLVATYTDGQPTESAAWFCKWLEETANDFRFGKTYLKGLRYAVFGLGNSVYVDHYNTVSVFPFSFFSAPLNG